MKNKTSISHVKSYAEIGEFWDAHDLGEYWDQPKPADLEVDIQSETRFFALDILLLEKVSGAGER